MNNIETQVMVNGQRIRDVENVTVGFLDSKDAMFGVGINPNSNAVIISLVDRNDTVLINSVVSFEDFVANLGVLAVTKNRK